MTTVKEWSQHQQEYREHLRNLTNEYFAKYQRRLMSNGFQELVDFTDTLSLQQLKGLTTYVAMSDMEKNQFPSGRVIFLLMQQFNRQNSKKKYEWFWRRLGRNLKNVVKRNGDKEEDG